MGKPRLNLRLCPDLLARLEAETRRPGVTKNAVIEKALDEYFQPAIRLRLDERLLQRLDKFEIRQGDVALSLETLGQFVLYWLTRTDPVPEGERETAHALGQRRFAYFIEQVARKVRRGGGLAGQLGMTPPAEAAHEADPVSGNQIGSSDERRSQGPFVKLCRCRLISHSLSSSAISSVVRCTWPVRATISHSIAIRVR